MSKEESAKIMEKLQELSDLFKDQTTVRGQKFKDELARLTNEFKLLLNDCCQQVENKYGEKIHEIQDRFVQSIPQRDQFIEKAAESLVEAIYRIKDKLTYK
ncbi:MAG: hypothetical protein GX905_06330 [Bacteroidales bacterium]|nr:hypothetical protein [Bacteroidales bacterium]